MAEISHPEATAEGSSQANAYTDEKAVYEVGFHIVSTIPEDGAGAVVEKLRAALKKAEAEILSEGALQKMTLAYTIERPVSGGKRERHDSAYFGWIKFEAAPETIPAFAAMLQSSNEVLRHLLIETVREDISAQPRRAVFTSDRLEGKTIEKRSSQPEKGGEVSEEELNKSIEALVK